MKSPSDAIIAVTHRCNAHCVMCNMWKSRAADALLPEHMRKLPPGLATVNLSGGEPFLRADLPQFVREVRARCKAAHITISSNGYLASRIAQAMDEIRRIDPAIRLALSLDGIGEAHDRIRGDAGAFGSVSTLIERLTADGFRGLRLGMTLTGANMDQLLATCDFAARRGLELGIVAAHGCATHLGLEHSPAGPMPVWLSEPFGTIISRWLRSSRPKQWLRAHFAWNTYRLLAGSPWKVRCRAGEDFFFVQADGEVYSCSVQGKPMGNLVAQGWPEIWQGPSAVDAREFVRVCPERCWMVCNARAVYRKHPLAVMAWVLSRKPLAHLGRLRMPRVAASPAPSQEPAHADSAH